MEKFDRVLNLSFGQIHYMMKFTYEELLNSFQMDLEKIEGGRLKYDFDYLSTLK